MPGMRAGRTRQNRRQRRRRTAVVVGGTAAVASHHGKKKADEKADEAYEQGAADQQATAQPAQSSSDNIAEVEKLAEMRDKGILTEEEFQAKKKQLLGL